MFFYLMQLAISGITFYCIMSAVEYDDNQGTGGQKKSLQFCGLGDVDCLLVSDTATHF